jgi:hypothetical protein
MAKQLAKLVLIGLIAALPACASAEYRFDGAERVVAMSDPHGAFDAMVGTLANAGVIDEERNWAAGGSHLVITGDLLDRGADSRPIMDLVMQLETQAAAAGGRVHLTLGNHEVMNLVGDLRYVAPGEYAAFADEESAEEREKWFQALLRNRSSATNEIVDEATLRAEFDRARPPGFYGHRAAFRSTGEYGRWLLGRPLMVVVNDTAFVHGGMPPIVAELGLDGLNDELGAEIADYVAAVELLNDAGLLDPAINFYEHAGVAESLQANAALPPDVVAALETVIRLNDARVHDSGSPLWYRGTVGCSVLSEEDVLTAALAGAGASRVVIGHTPTVTRRVLQRFDGRVIEIDTGMLKTAYRGAGYALILEGDDVAVAQQHSTELTTPVAHPRRVGDRSDSLTAEALAELLTTGDIVSTSTDEFGRTVAELRWNDDTVTALFAKSPRRKGREPELAAYRLDRMLGLDIVPVTVAREVDGQRGTLQFLPRGVRDEAFRSSSRQGGGAWCPLQQQWNSMYLFDVLTFNEGRNPNSMMYSPSSWQLISVGHGQAFGTGGGRPRFLAEAPLDVTAPWQRALQSLTDDSLESKLSDVLSGRQISAIGKRRDLLLEEAQ